MDGAVHLHHNLLYNLYSVSDGGNSRCDSPAGGGLGGGPTPAPTPAPAGAHAQATPPRSPSAPLSRAACADAGASCSEWQRQQHDGVTPRGTRTRRTWCIEPGGWGGGGR